MYCTTDTLRSTYRALHLLLCRALIRPVRLRLGLYSACDRLRSLALRWTLPPTRLQYPACSSLESRRDRKRIPSASSALLCRRQVRPLAFSDDVALMISTWEPADQSRSRSMYATLAGTSRSQWPRTDGFSRTSSEALNVVPPTSIRTRRSSGSPVDCSLPSRLGRLRRMRGSMPPSLHRCIRPAEHVRSIVSTAVFE